MTDSMVIFFIIILQLVNSMEPMVPQEEKKTSTLNSHQPLLLRRQQYGIHYNQNHKNNMIKDKEYKSLIKENKDMNEIFQTLYCPISNELMGEPVIWTKDGHTYEKEAILQWFKKGVKNGAIKSPKGGISIKIPDDKKLTLLPNLIVSSMIDEYVTKGFGNNDDIAKWKYSKGLILIKDLKRYHEGIKLMEEAENLGSSEALGI